jgi:hypothetical protein
MERYGQIPSGGTSTSSSTEGAEPSLVRRDAEEFGRLSDTRANIKAGRGAVVPTDAQFANCETPEADLSRR